MSTASKASAKFLERGCCGQLCDGSIHLQVKTWTIGRFTVVDWRCTASSALESSRIESPSIHHTASPGPTTSSAPTVKTSLSLFKFKTFSDLPTPKRKPDAQRIRSRRKPKHKPAEVHLSLAKQRGIRDYFSSHDGRLETGHVTGSLPVIGQDDEQA